MTGRRSATSSSSTRFLNRRRILYRALMRSTATNGAPALSVITKLWNVIPLSRLPETRPRWTRPCALFSSWLTTTRRTRSRPQSVPVSTSTATTPRVSSPATEARTVRRTRRRLDMVGVSVGLADRQVQGQSLEDVLARREATLRSQRHDEPLLGRALGGRRRVVAHVHANRADARVVPHAETGRQGGGAAIEAGEVHDVLEPLERRLADDRAVEEHRPRDLSPHREAQLHARLG